MKYHQNLNLVKTKDFITMPCSESAIKRPLADGRVGRESRTKSMVPDQGDSMNEEHPHHKTGLIGEYLVIIKLNYFGINTGSVDKDTGTDIVMFHGSKILTVQVKSGYQDWNYDDVHGVHVHFRVNLMCRNHLLKLDAAEIKWKRVDIVGSEFQVFSRESIQQMFA